MPSPDALSTTLTKGQTHKENDVDASHNARPAYCGEGKDDEMTKRNREKLSVCYVKSREGRKVGRVMDVSEGC